MEVNFELDSKACAILDAVQNETELNQWVGGGNARAIATQGIQSIIANVPINETMRVLDYGCGIGRISVALAQLLSRGQVVGCDIVPKFISFCKQNVQTQYDNTSFFCLDEKNPRYDIHKTDTAPAALTPDDFVRSIESSMDMIVAYSVFTHFSPEMALRHARLFHKALRNNGIVFISAFLNSPLNEKNRCLQKFEKFKDVPLKLPLSFAVYRLDYLEEIFNEAGFQLAKIIFGHWRHHRRFPEVMYHGSHYQDIVVALKIPFLPPNFNPREYLAVNPDLRINHEQAAEHYLSTGFYENKAYCDPIKPC